MRKIELPQLGFGGAPLGGLLHAVDDKAALDTLACALAADIRYFDTAPYYGFGLSERRIGDAVRGCKDIIISTKVGRLLQPGLPENPSDFGWPKPLPFHPVFDYGYDGVMRSFEDSLQRLGRDHIDIVFIHDIGPFTHPDPEVETHHFRQAMEGGYRALDTLRSNGDISAIGVGVNEVPVLQQVLQYGDWDLFLLAGRYTLLEQEEALPLMNECTKRSVRIIVGGPFNSGILAGADSWNYAPAPDKVKRHVAAIARICRKYGVPMPAAALRFPTAHPAVACVIPGTRSPSELTEMLDWQKVEIPSGFWEALQSENLIHLDAPIPA